LSWFKSKDDTQPQGAVPCNEIVAVEKLVGERAGKHHCFSLAVAGSCEHNVTKFVHCMAYGFSDA
jgi:hypothetical protein